MEISVLGPLEVRRGGTAIPLGAPKLRALLLSLVLDVGRVVHAERLIEELWGDDPPPQPLVSLRSYVSNLRRLLQEPDAPPVIATRAGGYVLEVPPDRVDAHRFERLVVDGTAALTSGDPAQALERLTSALSLWRGEALADIATEAHVRPTVTKLEERRLTAVEDRLEALLALGRHREALPELEAFVTEQPLRERPHRQLMVALYRAGRAPDALQVATDLRTTLVEDFGLDPSAELGALTDRILRQDPSLATPPTVPPATGRAPTAGHVDADDREAAAPDGQDAGTREASALVGRAREREALERAVTALSTGAGGVLLLAGEPGIGKSALLDELRRVARGRRVATAAGRGLEQRGTPAYWPWLEVLRTATAPLGAEELAALLRGTVAPVTQLAPELAAHAGIDVVAATGDPDHARFALHGAVADLLRALAADGGLVVVVDDLHWADPATLELFAFLTTRAADDGILLVGAYRDAPTERTPELDAAIATAVREPTTRTLRLRALDRDAVGALVAVVTGTHDDDALVDEVHRRSDGNPFFARQLAALLDDDAGHPDRPAIPLGVRHVLLRRLQALPARVHDTLSAAAVLGQAFDVRQVADLTDRSVLDALDDVDVAIGHGLVEVGVDHASAYAFVHALVRETLYDELPTGRAARLHLGAADLLDASDPRPHAALAEHLWRAGDAAPADRTVAHLRAAADEAIGVLALQQAEEQLRRALTLLGRATTSDARVELAVRLRLVQVQTMLSGWTHGDREQVTERVRELVGRTGLDADLVPLFWSMWSTNMTRGDLTVSRTLATELLEAALETGEPASLVAGYVAAAYTGVFTGADADRIEAWLDAASRAEAVAAPERLAATPEHLGVGLRATRAIRAGVLQQEAAALDAGDAAVRYAQRDGTGFHIAYARMFAAWSAALVDRPDRALVHSESGLAASRSGGYASVVALLLLVDGWARARQGSDASAEADRMQAALAALTSADQLHAVGHWFGLLAEVEALAGRPEAARAALARADEIAERTGERVYAPHLARIRSRLVD